MSTKLSQRLADLLDQKLAPMRVDRSTLKTNHERRWHGHCVWSAWIGMPAATPVTQIYGHDTMRNCVRYGIVVSRSGVGGTDVFSTPQTPQTEGS